MMKIRKALTCSAATSVLLLTLAFSQTALGSGQPNKKTDIKPNVVIIYGDDVGYGDVGAYGARLIPTPNMDKLAENGLRFTDSHCSSATCTRSRYSLLTGEMAFRKQGVGIAAGDAKMMIDPGQYTLADLFQQAGYKTAIIGKWHLGLGAGKIDWNGEIKPGPEALGFDHYFIFPATNDRTPCIYLANGRVVNFDPADPITVSYDGRIPDSVPGTNYPDGILNPEAITVYKGDKRHSGTIINGIGRIGYMKGGKSALFKDETIADVFVEKTEKFILENRDAPFFLIFSANDIHAPRWPHERFRGKSQAGLRGDAMVSFDWSAGRILDLLKEYGLEENTIVILTSDNGPVYIDGGYEDGSDRLTQPGEHYHPAAGIYRGGKYQIYEGGNRVPFIVRWPGKIKPGVSDALFTQTDLLASFAALLGKQIPPGQARDSRDYLATLLGKDMNGAEIILEQARGNAAIRRGTWKYIEEEKELYDLSVDPSETKNLATKRPDIAAQMESLLKKYRTQPLSDR